MIKTRGKIIIGIVLLCMILLSFGVLLSNASVAPMSERSIESYTDSDEFTYEGNTYDIQKYADSIDKKTILQNYYDGSELYGVTVEYKSGSQDNFNRLQIKGDDPITEIIPKNYFKKSNTETVHIGLEYGFFIKTQSLQDGIILANVVLFDVVNDIDLGANIDHAKFKIQNLFQREFIYIPTKINAVNTRLINHNKQLPDLKSMNQQLATNVISADVVIPLPYFSNMDIYVFSESGRYYMTDIVNTVALYNEQHSNNGDYDYNVQGDKGKFITQQDSEYNAKIYDVNSDRGVDAILTLLKAGFNAGADALIDLVPGLSETFGLLEALYETHSSTLDTVRPLNKKLTYMANYVTNQGQIENYGHLKRTAISKLEIDFANSSYGAGSFLYYGRNDYFTSDYQIAYTSVNSNDNGFNTPWEARIKRAFVLKFVNAQDNTDFVAGGDVHDQNLRKNDEREYRQLNEEQTVYLLPNGENLFKYTPPCDGTYTFTSTHANAPIIIEQIGSKQVAQTITNVDSYNKSMKLELKQGVEYRFRTAYTNKAKSGIYYLKFEFTPPNVFLGDNEIDLINDSTIVKFIPRNTVNYKFIFSDSNIPYTIYDKDFKAIELTNTVKYSYTLNKDQTYYIGFDRTNSAQKNVGLHIRDEMYVTLKNIESFDINSELTISSLDTVVFPSIYKNGYYFGGWRTLDGVDITNSNIKNKMQPQLNIYAVIEPILYNITYVENGGNDISNTTYTIQHTVILNNNIAKKNYVFGGWYDNAGFVGSAIDKIEAGSYDNKTFYAKWIGAVINVKLNVNSSQTDGVAAAIDRVSVTLNYGDNYTLPIPSLDGFKFAGWYNGNEKFTDSNGASVNPFTRESDTELIAHWEREKFYIKINLDEKGNSFKWLTKNGDDFTFSDDKQFIENEIGLCPNCYILQQIAKGGVIAGAVKKNLFKEGHIYEYMVTDPKDKSSIACWEGSELGFDFNDEAVIEIYAYHRVETEFKIDVEGTDNAVPMNIEKKYGEGIEFSQNPTKQGYDFKYWVVSNNGNNDIYKGTHLAPGNIFIMSTMPDLSINEEMDGRRIFIRPYFEGKNYIVNFGNVETAIPERVVKMGDPYNVSNNNALPVPQKSGWVFAGWYTDNGQSVTDKTGNTNSWNIPRNCTLIAQWTLREYYISYNANGGTMPDNYKIYFNMQTPTFDLPQPTRMNYKFSHWTYNGNPIYRVQVGTKTDLLLKAEWIGSERSITSEGVHYISDSHIIINFSNAGLIKNMKFMVKESVDEVMFIGSTGLPMSFKSIIVERRTRPLIMRLKNIDIFGDHNTAAINASACSKLILESLGKNKIRSGLVMETSGNKAALTCQSIDIIGDELEIYGSAAAQSIDGNGLNGDNGIIGGNIINNNNIMNITISKLYVSGGSGYAGVKGRNGSDQLSAPAKAGNGKVGAIGYSGENGADGGRGGSGGDGISFIGNITIASNSAVTCKGGDGKDGGIGGNGGTGGSGGEGGNGVFLTYGKEGGRGGSGGTGGNGGYGGSKGSGIYCSKKIIGKATTTDGKSGKGGKGGIGGAGGEGGLGGWTMKGDRRYSSGATGYTAAKGADR